MSERSVSCARLGVWLTIGFSALDDLRCNPIAGISLGGNSDNGNLTLHLRESRLWQDDVGPRVSGAHAAVLFCEDEWLTLLEAEINNLADFARCSKRLRAALAPHAIRLLQLGMPIVLDFAGNTPKDRAWVRSIFESADADHVLHSIVASDELCKARLCLRNATKPEGVYYGSVTEDRFDEVTRYFDPPSDQEKFNVIYYGGADVPLSKK
jgi:predicted kinase